MPTRREFVQLALILAIGLVGGLALIRLVEMPALGDFALIVVVIPLVPIGLIGVLVEDQIRSAR